MSADHPDPAASPADPAAPVPEQVLRARAHLSMLAGGPAPALAAFVDRHGPVDAVARLCGDGIPADVDTELRVLQRDQLRGADQADQLLADAEAAGLRLLTPEHDSEWPHQQLRSLITRTQSGTVADQRPLALWVRGSTPLPQLQLRRQVAVIGARAATGYGEHVAADFGYHLSTAGATVVTGGGYGIEAAATRGALVTEAPVLVVLANGTDVAYPNGHRDLFHRVCEQGALVSEYPPQLPPSRLRFAERTRLLTALTGTTVIVEATHRSGSLRAADTARQQNKPVFAVPGPVTSATSVGTHELIKRGRARLAATAADVLTALPNPPGTAPAQTHPQKACTHEQ